MQNKKRSQLLFRFVVLVNSSTRINGISISASVPTPIFHKITAALSVWLHNVKFLKKTLLNFEMNLHQTVKKYCQKVNCKWFKTTNMYYLLPLKKIPDSYFCMVIFPCVK